MSYRNTPLQSPPPGGRNKCMATSSIRGGAVSGVDKGRQARFHDLYVIDRKKPLSRQELERLRATPKDVYYGTIKSFTHNRRVFIGSDVTVNRKSTVPHAGNGLFVNQSLKTGDILLFEFHDSEGEERGRRNINDHAFDLNAMKTLVDGRKVDLFEAWRYIVDGYISALPRKSNLVPITYLDANLNRIRPPMNPLKKRFDAYLVVRPIRKGAELSISYTIAVWARLLTNIFPRNADNLKAWRNIYRDAAKHATTEGMKKEMIIMEKGTLRDIASYNRKRRVHASTPSSLSYSTAAALPTPQQRLQNAHLYGKKIKEYI